MTTRTTTSGNSMWTRQRYTCAPRHHGGKKHTNTHTQGYIRLFYYIPTIKQCNVIIVRFPDVGGGSLAFFFYYNLCILGLYAVANREHYIYLLIHDPTSIDRLPWENLSRNVPYSFHRYTMVSTDKLFVSFYNNNLKHIVNTYRF